MTHSRTVGPVDRHLETRLLASIFDTLLSSQGSDAHHLLTFRPASGATLQSYSLRYLGVKSRRSLSEAVDRARLALREVVHCSSLSTRLEPPWRADLGALADQLLFGGVCPGTGLLRGEDRGGVRSSLSG